MSPRGTKVQGEQAVETMINSIIDSLKKGEEVSIAGIGHLLSQAARRPRSPQPTHRRGHQGPAMKVPKFRAAKALKDAVK